MLGSARGKGIKEVVMFFSLELKLYRGKNPTKLSSCIVGLKNIGQNGSKWNISSGRGAHTNI